MYNTEDQRHEIIAEGIAQDPTVVASLAESSGYWASEADRLVAMEAKEQASEAERLARLELDDFEMLHNIFFEQRNKVHEENVDFFKSFQWTEEDKKAIIEQHRKPYVSNEMRRFILTLLGEQVGSRTDWRAVGQNQQSQDKAELLNHILRWVAQRNTWERTESMIFRDGVVGGIGVGQVRLDPNDPFGNILIERHRPQEFMWDIESAHDSSLQGSSKLWRGYYVMREHLAAEFPEWRDDIMQGQGGLASGRRWNDMFAYKRPKVRETAGQLTGGVTHDPMMQRAFKNFVFKREFYRRRYDPKFRVVNGHTGEQLDFETAQQAWDGAKQLYQFYNQQEVLARYNVTQPLVSEPRMVNVPVIDQLVWCGDLLLRVNKGDRDRYPYKFYAPEWYDGDLTSYFEHGKDEQRMRNRLMSYLDLIASGVKGATIVNRNKLPGDWTDQKIMDMAMQPNQVWVIDDHTGQDASQIVHHVPPPNYNQLPVVLYNMLQENMTTQFGGPNTIGQSAFAGQSGRSADQLRSAASLSLIPTMEAFRYFKQEIGEDVCHLAKFLDPNLQMMVSDGMNNPTFRSIISEGIQSIDDLKFSIQITEVTASPTERDARMSKLMQLAGQIPEFAQDMGEVLLGYADIDESDKKKILAARDSRVQFQQQMEERQQALQEETEKARIQVMVLGQLVKLKEMENPPKPPVVTLSVKPDPSPGLVATILEAAGMQADPVGIMGDQAVHNVMNQEKLNAQQINRNKNLLPAEKQALKPKAPKTVPAAKDSAARGNK